MNFILHKQKPKPDKKGIEGNLAVHDLPPEGLAAYFFQDEKILAQLNKPDIVFINPPGIMLRGYEPAGVDRQGRQKFTYQEWFLRFKD